MRDRVEHLNVLEQFLASYKEWGEHKDVEDAIEFAIASIKTDIKYDLIYEGRDVYTKEEVIELIKGLKDKLDDNQISGWDKNTAYGQGFIDGVDANKRAYEKVILDEIKTLKEK